MSNPFLTLESMKLDSDPPNSSLEGSVPGASLEPPLELASPPPASANPAPSHPRRPNDPTDKPYSLAVPQAGNLHHFSLLCTTLHQFCSHARPTQRTQVRSGVTDVMTRRRHYTLCIFHSALKSSDHIRPSPTKSGKRQAKLGGCS